MSFLNSTNHTVQSYSGLNTTTINNNTANNGTLTEDILKAQPDHVSQNSVIIGLVISAVVSLVLLCCLGVMMYGCAKCKIDNGGKKEKMKEVRERKKKVDIGKSKAEKAKDRKINSGSVCEKDKLGANGIENEKRVALLALQEEKKWEDKSISSTTNDSSTSDEESESKTMRNSSNVDSSRISTRSATSSSQLNRGSLSAVTSTRVQSASSSSTPTPLLSVTNTPVLSFRLPTSMASPKTLTVGSSFSTKSEHINNINACISVDTSLQDVELQQKKNFSSHSTSIEMKENDLTEITIMPA